VIPFTAFGLSGLFHRALNTHVKMIGSMLFVSLIRLVSATLSGVILWSSSIEYAMAEVESGGEPNIATRIFASMGESLWLYSFAYNFIYIFTTTALVILVAVMTRKRLLVIVEPQVKRL
jgi:thiamine transporter